MWFVGDPTSLACDNIYIMLTISIDGLQLLLVTIDGPIFIPYGTSGGQIQIQIQPVSVFDGFIPRRIWIGFEYF